jgi:hypothetical protein
MNEMRDTNHGMTYVCPHCEHRMKTPLPQPEKWPAKWKELDPIYRRLCECCNRFAVPLPYWLACGQRAWSATIFSNCPNAPDCWLHNQYDATCEKGLMQPKCLVAVHQTLAMTFEQIAYIQGIVDKGPGGRNG